MYFVCVCWFRDGEAVSTAATAPEVVITEPATPASVIQIRSGPNIIWDGEVLEKFPFSFAGSSKKRWFQVRVVTVASW